MLHANLQNQMFQKTNFAFIVVVVMGLRAYNRLEEQTGAKHGIRPELGPYTNTASPRYKSKISLKKI